MSSAADASFFAWILSWDHCAAPCEKPMAVLDQRGMKPFCPVVTHADERIALRVFATMKPRSVGHA